MWLREHPRVEVISLDRAGDFAKGGRLGAPSALQIADRWHVIQHLAQALDPALRRLGRALGFSKHTTQKKEPETKSSTPVIGLTPAQHQRRENLHERFGQVEAPLSTGAEPGRDRQDRRDREKYAQVLCPKPAVGSTSGKADRLAGYTDGEHHGKAGSVFVNEVDEKLSACHQLLISALRCKLTHLCEALTNQSGSTKERDSMSALLAL